MVTGIVYLQVILKDYVCTVLYANFNDNCFPLINLSSYCSTMRWIVCLALLGIVAAQRRRGGGRGGRRDEGIVLNPGPNECLYTFTIPNTALRVSTGRKDEG